MAIAIMSTLWLPNAANAETFIDGFLEVQSIGAEANIDGSKSVSEIIFDVLLQVVGLIAVIALAVLICAGIMYITSLGEPDRIDKAKRIIIGAVVGLVLCALAALIVVTVGNIFTT